MLSTQIPAVVRRKWRRTIAETRYGYYNRLTRRTVRLLIRLTLFIALLIIIFAFHDSRKPQEDRVMRGEVMREQLARRLGPLRAEEDLRSWHGWAGIKNIFAFGDSHTDTGFNLRGPQPDRENPIGNPGFPGRTSTYGANYLGHMTATYNRSFIRTYNMANKLSPFFHHTEMMKMPSFAEQIEQKFLKRYGPSTKLHARSSGTGAWIQSESLFVMYVGADDIMQSFGAALENKTVATMEDNLRAYSEGLAKLYDAGARNFLILNWPQLENAPGIKNYGDRAGESKAYWRLGASIVQYNSRLAFLAHIFGESHADANVFVFNTHKMSLSVVLEPTRFPETSTYSHLFGYCWPYADNHWWVKTEDLYDPGCGDGLVAYLWRDEFHYSEPFQRLLARMSIELMEDPKNRLPQEFY